MPVLARMRLETATVPEAMLDIAVEPDVLTSFTAYELFE
jgi:hypothetical protein